MKVAEIYKSVQGEGFLTGAASAFVRASGCNLRCRYCDTPYASWQPEGDDLSVDEILARVSALECDHVVVTGGEPMLFAELIPLTAELRKRGLHVTIETAGTLYLPLDCDLMSISPKLANSTPNIEQVPRWRTRHERTRYAPEVIRRLVAEYPYQVKFVIQSLVDCLEAEEYLQEFPEIDHGRVMFMPEATTCEALARQTAWLEPYCKQHGWHFCPRKHIEWFGLVRGT
ncbi:MAG: 7-carboxy-7-deazaguanine synthase QueE [Planctomycetota bacterium]|nr:MAG: 7-carboxy-7-deazaguanine synthase QueE [Planctomycetota bacterium]